MNIIKNEKQDRKRPIITSSRICLFEELFGKYTSFSLDELVRTNPEVAERIISFFDSEQLISTKRDKQVSPNYSMQEIISSRTLEEATRLCARFLAIKYVELYAEDPRKHHAAYFISEKLGKPIVRRQFKEPEQIPPVTTGWITNPHIEEYNHNLFNPTTDWSQLVSRLRECDGEMPSNLWDNIVRAYEQGN